MINYLEHHIVDHCNLNCIGCSHFSPLSNPWYEDINDFTKDFTELAVKTNQQVGVIRLMGGEPLLHPNVGAFLVTARNLFPNSEIQLVTNGLLLKHQETKDKLLNICNYYNIVVCVSDYGLNLNLHELLSGFNHVRVDSKNELYNISLYLDGNDDSQYEFDYCDLHINHWYYFQGGRFYPCCVAGNIHIFNEHFGQELPDDVESNSISIYEHSVDEVEEFLNKPIGLCLYCDTVRRSQNYHPASVSKKEITEWTYQS